MAQLYTAYGRVAGSLTRLLFSWYLYSKSMECLDTSNWSKLEHRNFRLFSAKKSRGSRRFRFSEKINRAGRAVFVSLKKSRGSRRFRFALFIHERISVAFGTHFVDMTTLLSFSTILYCLHLPHHNTYCYHSTGPSPGNLNDIFSLVALVLSQILKRRKLVSYCSFAESTHVCRYSSKSFFISSEISTFRIVYLRTINIRNFYHV